MRVVSVVGARPQFVKLAPIARALGAASAGSEPVEHLVVHTGQHYDTGMSEVFFHELGMPEPTVNLGVGSGSHGKQTAHMLAGIEEFLAQRLPDAVIVYGDTNSTLAGALAASKMNIATAHVEAGLRSFNRRMPEELNRVTADHLCDLLLAPTTVALENLRREGLEGRVRLVGDVMLDAVLQHVALARRNSGVLERLGLNGCEYAVATVHRASNTEPSAIAQVLGSLCAVAADIRVVLPIHPRTRGALAALGSLPASETRLKVIDPLSYLDMLKLVDSSAVVITDSGGLQKEAFILGRPCVTLRDETEWTETIEAGANVLAGTLEERVIGAVRDWRRCGWARNASFADKAQAAYGRGHAAERISDAIRSLASRPTTGGT